jgi:hypothetical protein
MVPVTGWLLAGLTALSLTAGPAAAETAADGAPVRLAFGDAWWTGPLITPGAGTLPKGRMLIETYLLDSQPYGRIDAQGHYSDLPGGEHNFGSLTYLLYGLTDRVTVGAVPYFGVRRSRGGSGMGVGDISLQAQYRLTTFREGSAVPTISVAVKESLPTGRFDRLDRRPGDGFGSGAYATTLALWSQTYFRMENGRLLRTRLDVDYTVAGRAKPEGVSVYGTPAGFRGRADPGDGVTAYLAFEYSVTRNWVLAMDLGYERHAPTRVSGTVGAELFERRYGTSHAFVVAPAVAYNFSPTLGVIGGVRVIPAGRNMTTSVAPVIAINYVR